MRASAVTVWINCQLSPVTCGQLNLTLLPIDVGSLSAPLDVTSEVQTDVKGSQAKIPINHSLMSGFPLDTRQSLCRLPEIG